jgi:hypothetical protein
MTRRRHGPTRDGDGLPDAEEDPIGTDPNDADSDDDGVPTATSPTSPTTPTATASSTPSTPTATTTASSTAPSSG